MVVESSTSLRPTLESKPVNDVLVKTVFIWPLRIAVFNTILLYLGVLMLLLRSVEINGPWENLMRVNIPCASLLMVLTQLNLSVALPWGSTNLNP